MRWLIDTSLAASRRRRPAGRDAQRRLAAIGRPNPLRCLPGICAAARRDPDRRPRHVDRRGGIAHHRSTRERAPRPSTSDNASFQVRARFVVGRDDLRRGHRCARGATDRAGARSPCRRIAAGNRARAGRHAAAVVVEPRDEGGAHVEQVVAGRADARWPNGPCGRD